MFALELAHAHIRDLRREADDHRLVSGAGRRTRRRSRAR
jgi:hypothetical protein